MRVSVSRRAAAAVTAVLLGLLTVVASAPAAGAAAPFSRADCEHGANGFIDIPDTLVGTQVGAPAIEWAGQKITLEYARRGGGTYGFARLSGGQPEPGDWVRMDVTNDGGAHWIQCGPFVVSNHYPLTSAAYPTSSSSLRKFRACGVIYVFAEACTPPW